MSAVTLKPSDVAICISQSGRSKDLLVTANLVREAGATLITLCPSQTPLADLATINLAVDACNAVSLHSGFPISVVDLDRARQPFRIGIAPNGASYVFNASGQTIDLAGLLCLSDGDGPCANAVRDAQRTKTSPDTLETLSVIWGCAGFEARLAETERWYRALLEQAGAATESVVPGS